MSIYDSKRYVDFEYTDEDAYGNPLFVRCRVPRKLYWQCKARKNMSQVYDWLEKHNEVLGVWCHDNGLRR